MEYSSLTVDQLKKKCSEKGLPVGGTKKALIERLTAGASSSTPSTSTTSSTTTTSSSSSSKKKTTRAKRKDFTTDEVNQMLRDAGIDDPDSVSRCVKRAILKSYIRINGPDSLDKTLMKAPCPDCQKEVTVTIREVLYQDDYAGTDYEEGGEDASVKCPSGKCSGIYVTGICTGKPEFDSGKFHNHCEKCPDFGVCIGDYREAHCDLCGNHYFQGLSGLSCDNCYDSDGKLFKSDEEDDDELFVTPELKAMKENLKKTSKRQLRGVRMIMRVVMGKPPRPRDEDSDSD
eukprot:TRINITY_DN14643_c0_g1_i1.p1 TRINITY_DN14643_c0_g1~~TRINITY_DN14643_c0_g1_i1.p1  ORF type:complete len:288 (-),score=67.34 TRINITY_DN14643_c0_g1_i1:172-1035(-)